MIDPITAIYLVSFFGILSCVVLWLDSITVTEKEIEEWRE